MEIIKEKGREWIKNKLKDNITYTKLGSLNYLFYGRRKSEQSKFIKLGRFGEYFTKELIMLNKNLELMFCGIQKINNKNKDVDLIFKDNINNIIYYRELKGNIELDTEKLPATINKCNEINLFLKKEYDYEINFGILNWSIYNRDKSNLNIINSFEKNGIKIDHFKDFLNIIDVEWNEEDFYEYFLELGKIFND